MTPIIRVSRRAALAVLVVVSALMLASVPAQGEARVDTDLGTRSWFLATVGGHGANLRSCANTGCSTKGSVPAWTNVRIVCQIRSQTVTGYYGTSNVWDYVVWEGTGREGFAADANIYTGYDWIPGIDTCR